MADYGRHLRAERSPRAAARKGGRIKSGPGGSRTLLDKARAPTRDIFGATTDDRLQGSGFKWLISTLCAAAVGLLAIGGVIYAHLGPEQGSNWMPKIAEADPEPIRPVLVTGLAPEASLLALKSDRAETMSGGIATRHIIHDPIEVKRGGRPFIAIKPYARVVARLATSPPPASITIPPFSPVRLFTHNTTASEQSEENAATPSDTDVAVKVIELLGGIIPDEDGQELEGDEVARLVARAGEELSSAADLRATSTPEGSETTSAPLTRVKAEPLPPRTTVLVRTEVDAGDSDEIEGQETRGIKVARGETLFAILRREGAEVWQAREIIDAVNTTYPVAQLTEGHQLKLTLVPSANIAKRMEPLRLSIFSEAGQHRATVVRNDTGAFVSVAGNLEAEISAAQRDEDEPLRATVYASLYQAGLMQNLPPDIIELIMRIHASDVEFKRRVREGDGVELFFDLREDDKAGNGPLGELLFTSIVVGSETKRFFRFRSSDGRVDYFDEAGNNSRKFLLQKPVIGPAQFTSGYGVRVHPISRLQRMHAGMDWSAPVGTPVVAAGNGIVEEAANKGPLSYGNYIRIRHPNGYKTAYGHLSRFAPGIQPGARVRQNQIIGYVGNTGYSTAPHLHFEVMVNNSFMDPRRVPADRERKLEGRELQEFQKERVRIEKLMGRPPVYTYVSQSVPDVRTARR